MRAYFPIPLRGWHDPCARSKRSPVRWFKKPDKLAVYLEWEKYVALKRWKMSSDDGSTVGASIRSAIRRSNSWTICVIVCLGEVGRCGDVSIDSKDKEYMQTMRYWAQIIKSENKADEKRVSG
jgi:hypothetical protein